MLHTAFSLVTQDLWAAFLIALFFGGSIFVHELGHFLAARMTGVHVDRFSIGFGPAIFSWKGKSGVEYRISWLPLGGYVLLPQLADLSMIEGKPSNESPAQQVVDAKMSMYLSPPTYATKMIVFVAGAFFNVLFALGLATIIYIVGEPQLQALSDTRVGYVTPNFELPNGQIVPSPAAAGGLRAGDKIQSIDGTTVHDWNDLTTLVKLSSVRSPAGQPMVRMVVDRDGRRVPLTLYPLLVGDVEMGLDSRGFTDAVASKPLAGGADRYRQIGISSSDTLLLAKVTPGSPAALAGFQEHDQIEAVDGVHVYSPFTFLDALSRDIGGPAHIDVMREGKRLHLTVASAAPAAVTDKTLRSTAAVATGFAGFTSPTVIVHPSPFRQVWEEAVTTARTVVSLVNPHSDVGLSKMSGVIGIVQVYHEIAPEGVIPILALTILINVNLAILNLLPVPILDGGQMLFATVSWIRGRNLPVNFVAATQSVFLMLIVVLMVYIGWFDILRWRHG